MSGSENELSYIRHGFGWPVVLLHGYLGGALVWKGLQEEFASAFDMVAPDLSGFGSSSALPSPKTISGHALQVLALIDKLGFGRFHVIGHSMGGMIAQEIALMAPDRVAKLVLYGTSAGGQPKNRFETVERTRQRLQCDGVYETGQYIASTWFAKKEQAHGYAECVKIAGAASLQGATSATYAFSQWSSRERLSSIRASTLVVWGDLDRSVGIDECMPLWQEIDDSALAVCPRCAHNVHYDNPELFYKHIRDFFLHQ